MKRLQMVAALLGMLAAMAGADLVVEQWGGQGPYAHPDTLKASGDGQKIEVDLSALPAGAKVVRARLIAFRDEPAFDRDEALADVEISEGGKRLELIGPWYDRFAVPPQALAGKKSLTLTVGQFPGWLPDKTVLEIAYEGKPAADLPAVKAARAVHQAGQTFITWDELDKLVPDAAAWGAVRNAIDKRDQEKRVRYRVYASAKPITAANLAEAEPLAEVEPLSGLNIHGRSSDQVFKLGRQKMLDDMDYAKKVASNWYTIPPTEADNVVIDRFVIPGSDKPLPNGAGLFVHHPRDGKGYYAVTVMVNGRESTAAPAVAGPIDEKAGRGEPVLQREMDMKVLFDYPGRRLQYVQWTAPPLSNLPGRYYNWGVFVPRSTGILPVIPTGETPVLRETPVIPTAGTAVPPALDLVLTGNDMYRRPRWPHLLDTVYVSPHDAPARTWYFGYPESVGTLRGLKSGPVHPYTWRRMLAFVEWAKNQFKTDSARTTCSGDRGRSATAALHLGMRHPEVFSLVYTCKGMPDPSAIPVSTQRDGKPAPTEVADLQRLIGKKEWGLKLDTGQNVWEFFKLADEVAAHPEIARPMLSTGGRGGGDWPPIAALFKVCSDTHQPVISRGEWGELDPAGLKNPGHGISGLDVWLDRPMPVFTNCSSDYQGGRNGDGGSTNVGIWWDNASIMDTPEKFELVLTGGATADVTPRRLKAFAIKPGESIKFEVVQLGGGGRDKAPATASGAVTADKLGLVTVPKVAIAGKTKLVLSR